MKCTNYCFKPLGLLFLLCLMADEALQAVTYFIDDAIQVGCTRVRILHGTGTGVLRQVIRQYLKTVPGVSHFQDEHVQLGGAGITVVELN